MSSSPRALLTALSLTLGYAWVSAKTADTDPNAPRLMVQSGHTELHVIQSISPSGRLAATADSSTIKIWAVDVGRLVCELRPTVEASEGKKSGGSQKSQGGFSESTLSMAWSGDDTSLLVPDGRRSLRRFDLSRCAGAETVELRLPDPRPSRKLGDRALPDNDIEEVSTLKDGQILVRTGDGLFAVRINGSSAEGKVLAHIPSNDPAEMQMPSLQDLMNPNALGKVFDAMTSSLAAYSIGAHSADGRVAVLTAQAPNLGPIVMPFSGAEPMVISDGTTRPLTSFQGATDSYKGASTVAVSASGQWLAVRSATPKGALISLFHVPSRKLVRQEKVTTTGGAEVSAGPLTEQMLKSYDQSKAVAGMAFSPDEKRLLLLRPRTKATGQALNDPTLELRRVDDLRVERQIPLQGIALDSSDPLSGVSSANGNGIMPSATQSGFMFQNTSFTRGATMATGLWTGDVPTLSSWTATEGPVTGLRFADDLHLVSTQRVMRDLSPDPVSPTGTPAQMAEAFMNSMYQSRQVVTWDLELGKARQEYVGRTVARAAKQDLVDPFSDRVLGTALRMETPTQPTHEIVMQSMRSRADVWRISLRDADGTLRIPGQIAWSPDRKRVAVLSDQGGTRNPSQPPATTAPSRPAPSPTTPQSSDKSKPASSGMLGGLLGGALGDQLKRMLPPGTPGFSDQPPPSPTQGGVPAPNPGATRSTKPGKRLHLLDADTGRTLASLDLPFQVSGNQALIVLSDERILLGNRLVDVRPSGGQIQLAPRQGKAFEGKVVGTTPVSGRPIITAGSSSSDLNALVLPSSLATATWAGTTADDRWLVVFDGGTVSVRDASRPGNVSFTADLPGDIVTSAAISPNGRTLAVGTSQGLVKLFDLKENKPLPSLLALSDGSWVVADRKGFFDASNLGSNPSVHWVRPDAPLTAAPFDTFMRAYYTPNLLVSAINGDDAVQRLPDRVGKLLAVPQVTIDKVVASPAKPGMVNVQVTVTPQADAQGRPSGATDLRLFRDGRLVGYAPQDDGALELNPSTGRYTKTFDNIRLPDGMQSVNFHAYAFNSEGLKGPTASSEFKSPKAVKGNPARAYVLTIGINRYDDPAFQTLGFAVNDAQVMQHALTEGLRKARTYSEVIGVSLESAPGASNHATKARIRAAIGLLAGRPDTAKVLADLPQAARLAAATPNDLVIISFAGHGYVSNLNNEFHLVPSDVQPTASINGLARFDGQAVSARELDLWLRDVDAGQLALVIDACHSAAAVAEGFQAGPMGSRGLGQLTSDKGARLLAATQAADVALEHKKLQNGFLTYVLVREGLLDGRADLRPTDGRVDLLEWLRYAETRLPAMQAELQQGTLKIGAQGEVPVATRGATRVTDIVPTGPEKGLQRPKLFDSVPPGNAVPVVGLTGR